MDWTSKRITRCLLLAIISSWITIGKADIYRWEDAQGRVYYSDRPHPQSEKLTLNPGFSYYQVAKVHDGDTVILASGERVRLLGINAPEIESHRQMGEPGGQAARDWLEKQIGRRKVRLQWDVERRDKYQRLLAHLFTEEGTHLNLALVKAGLASVNLIPPNFNHSDPLLQAQEQAEQARRGIWGMAEYAPRDITTLPLDQPRGWQRYTGTPVAVRQGRTFDRLAFSETIDVRIPRENLSLFLPLQDYLGQALEIRGWVSRRGNHYSILVNHPGMIKKDD